MVSPYAYHYAGAGCSSGGNNYVEMYAYSQPGQVWRKTFRLVKGSAQGDLEAVYNYDAEGKMLSQQYPLGTTYSYTYDAMGRATGMTDTGTSSNLVSTVTHGPSGELLSMTATSVSESRTYNVMGQVTNITGSGMNINYNYAAAGSNNGQISSQQDLISGETVSYAYDSLKRLGSASSNQGWGQAFTYDGFGNLTAKTATAGSPPVGSYASDPTTNRLVGGNYDANGNWGGASGLYGYDVSNRMTVATATSQQALYEYNPGNKRVMQLAQTYNGSNWITSWQAFYFYDVSGAKLGNYTADVSGSTVIWSFQSAQVFFQGRLIQRGGSVTQQDLRGSLGRYFSYGEEQTTPNAPNDQVKCATYTRDSVTSLDFAEQRYYSAVAGAFRSPDPSQDGVVYSDPSTWNAYAYTLGDPINSTDPSGMITCGDIPVSTGFTVSSYMYGGGAAGLLTRAVWHEGGPVTPGGNNQELVYDAQVLIGQAILNRLAVVNA